MDNLEINIIIVRICNKKIIQVMIIIKNKNKNNINNHKKLMFQKWKNFD